MSTRRLAAIMFTDIAGYTQLMQESEARANELRKRHREVFEQYHQTYNGKIIQYFGDGTLSSFDSSVEAVKCAVDMQKAFQQAPEVPLRIGIHLGDIVFSGKDVYGDGVNIASRVESLSLPGAILISDVVNQQIQNHEIATISMGTFRMKNVKKPIEVFAVQEDEVVLPKRKEIQGKAKRFYPLLQLKQLVGFASVGFVAMVLGAILFWFAGASNEELLPKSIREEKVAVAIFENFTGDSELDALGYLASEWIASSLQEVGIKTVAPEMIRQYKEYIGVLPGNPEGKISFKEVTQAEYVVSGSYFLQGSDSIRLNTRLLSTQTGEEITQLPSFWSKKSEKEQLIEEVRQRLMSYWAIEKRQHFPKVKPPKYEAYAEYIDCRDVNIDCYLRVFERDSTFILNRINLMFSAVYWNSDSIFYASKNYIQSHWDECTEYEKNFFTFSNEFWEGNYDKAFQAGEKNYRIDPLNTFMTQETGSMASIHMKRPDLALPILQQLMDNYDVLREKLEGFDFAVYVDALNRLGRYNEVIMFVEQLPEDDWLTKSNRLGWFELFWAYLHTEQSEKAIAYVDEILQHQDAAINYTHAAYAWSTFYQDSIPNPFHDKIRQRIGEFRPVYTLKNRILPIFWTMPNDLDAYQYYVLGDWEESERQFLAIKEIDAQHISPNNPLQKIWSSYFKIWVESMLGNIYARQGKTESALKQINKLKEIEATLTPAHSSPLRGIMPYWQARIHAILGNKEEAVDLLQKSIDEGRVMNWWNFKIDWELSGLRGYEPYEKLVWPYAQ